MRPAVQTIRVFSDKWCSKEVFVTYVDQSGHYNGKNSGNGAAAFDSSDARPWRPQCGDKVGYCGIGEAWVTFSTDIEIQCVEAQGLGQGHDGKKGKHEWNGGIKVELQDEGSWKTVLLSKSGNNALSKSYIEEIFENLTSEFIIFFISYALMFHFITNLQVGNNPFQIR